MKFYIAGGWAHRADIEKKARELEADGRHTCTYKWFAKSHGLDKRADALFDQLGVEQADVVIVVADDPAYVYRGTLFELGMAVGLKKPVLALLPADEAASDIHKCVFVNSPAITRVASWEDVLRTLAVHDVHGKAPVPRVE